MAAGIGEVGVGARGKADGVIVDVGGRERGGESGSVVDGREDGGDSTALGLSWGFMMAEWAALQWMPRYCAAID